MLGDESSEAYLVGPQSAVKKPAKQDCADDWYEYEGKLRNYCRKRALLRKRYFDSLELKPLRFSLSLSSVDEGNIS